MIEWNCFELREIRQDSCAGRAADSILETP